MDNEFPKMLYKAGGPHEIHGGRFDTLIAESADEQDAAIAEGWCLTSPDALDAAKPKLTGTAESKPKAKA